MPKPKTKSQKYKDIFTLYKTGAPPKGAKDGSIPTHPVLLCPPLLERDVLKQCISWLKIRRVYCNRHDCGAGDMGHGFAVYGIKGAGDIIGLLPNGKHFEIECKKGAGGRLSKDQIKRKKKITNNNGLYFVVHGVEELSFLMLEHIV